MTHRALLCYPHVAGSAATRKPRLRGRMRRAYDLRYLCLLAAASGFADSKLNRGRKLRPFSASMRCVIYMLIAFSLRRRNIGRRNLRAAPQNPNTPNSSRLRYEFAALAFRRRLRSTFNPFFSSLPHKLGALAITYM